MTYMPKPALQIHVPTASISDAGYRSCLNMPVLALCAAAWTAVWITGAALAALF